MPEASKAQKAAMNRLGIRYRSDVSMRDASTMLESDLSRYDGMGRARKGLEVCHDCDQDLTPTEKLSLMPDGTTAGTYPKRPVCHHCYGRT